MFILRKQFRFQASHKLPGHDGKCARLHGHSWIGYIEIQGEELIEGGAKAGMLLDYGDIGAVVKPIVDDYLDHWHLNDSTGLENPTSEEIARWMFEKLAVLSPIAIIIEETCTSRCEYRP